MKLQGFFFSVLFLKILKFSFRRHITVFLCLEDNINIERGTYGLF